MSKNSITHLKRYNFNYNIIVKMTLMAFDTAIIFVSYFLGLWLRFECNFDAIPKIYLTSYLHFIPFYILVSLVVFWACKLYKSIWRFASYYEFLSVIMATVITAFIHIIGITFIFERMPISYYCLGIVFQFVFILGVRFSYRFILLLRKNLKQNNNYSKVMLIGAGAAGQMILREVMKSNCEDKICCIIDDNKNKWNMNIEGVPVVGGKDDILSSVEKYGIEKIYFAIPSASIEESRDFLNICKETNCELKKLPGMFQLVNGEVHVSSMKPVSVEDLLGRNPIKFDMREIFRFITGKSILVTGGGGSIGSELCRQIAAHRPKQLIIFDIYENNAYNIQLELKEKYPELNLVTLIGSVRDRRRINKVFEDYKPDVVYHAAAHKHVPLMEDSPCESIKNNVIGTYKTALAAVTHGCKKFVLISTDKAVNPTNIMGASKRLCEMVIQSFAELIHEGRADEIPKLFTHAEMDTDDGDFINIIPSEVKTDFAAVRFGNILGSNGSVIPIFKHQIEKGGPVTVTHPDIIRYFMTIPEAVSLVLEAGTFAKGGEIFVLDMGSPVKIDTLARNLIKLSGHKPDQDIKIEYTGLRQGEKLYEEKLMSEEGLRKTKNMLIHIGSPIPFDTDEFLVKLEKLMYRAYENDENIKLLVSKIVKTYSYENIEERQVKNDEYIKLLDFEKDPEPVFAEPALEM